MSFVLVQPFLLPLHGTNILQRKTLFLDCWVYFLIFPFSAKKKRSPMTVTSHTQASGWLIVQSKLPKSEADLYYPWTPSTPASWTARIGCLTLPPPPSGRVVPIPPPPRFQSHSASASHRPGRLRCRGCRGCNTPEPSHPPVTSCTGALTGAAWGPGSGPSRIEKRHSQAVYVRMLWGYLSISVSCSFIFQYDR